MYSNPRSTIFLMIFFSETVGQSEDIFYAEWPHGQDGGNAHIHV